MKINHIKGISLFVAIVMLCLALAGCDGAKPAVSNEDKYKPTTDKTDYYVGEALVTDSIRIAYIASGELGDTGYLAPNEGNKYVFIALFAENISTDKVVSVSQYEFDCIADGVKCDLFYSAYGAITGSLSPGRRTEGIVCFQIPKDSKDVKFVYKAGSEYNFIYEGKKTSTLTSEPNLSETANAHKKGEKVTIGTTDITLLSYGVYEGEDIQPSSAGYKTMYAEFEITNNSRGNLQATYLFFNGYGDGYALKKTFGADDELSVELKSGESATGKLFYYVPEETKVFEVEYKPSLLAGDIVVFDCTDDPAPDTAA